jgi:hypothetical protein
MKRRKEGRQHASDPHPSAVRNDAEPFLKIFPARARLGFERGQIVAGQSDIVWYVARDGERYGPLTQAEFASLERSGDLTATDLVWNSSFSDWLAYSALPARANHLPKTPNTTSVKPSLLHLLARVLKGPREGVRTALSVIFSPSQLARERIDRSPRDLQRAIWFFINSFSLVVLASSYFTFLDYYSGLSQPRELLTVVIQLVIALPLLFGAALLSNSAISFTGITQAALYVDAMLLLIGNAIAILIAVATGDLGPRQLDIFGTEYERCLAEQSLAYWILRGDLTFYAQPLWKTPSVGDWVRLNLPYLIFVPFCVLFGFVLAKRYASSLWLMAIAAMSAFLIVVNLHDYATDAATRSIAERSDCFPRSIQDAQSRYSRPLLIEQGAAQINRQLSVVTNQKQFLVAPLSDGYLVKLKDDANNTLVPETMTWIEDARALYCHDGTNFRYARFMKEPLTIVIEGARGQELVRRLIGPTDCKR